MSAHIGGYRYLTDEEWMNLSTVDSFSLSNLTALNTQPRGELNDLDNLDDLNILEGVAPSAQTNENRQAINAFLRDPSTSTMIEKIAKYKERLELERDQLEDIISDKLDLSAFKKFLQVKSDKATDQFVFDNLGSIEEISHSVRKMDEFLERVIGLYGAEVEGGAEFERYRDELKNSLKATLTWHRIDLSKPAIGNIRFLARLAVEMMQKASAGIPVFQAEGSIKSGFADYFGVYLGTGIADQFLNQIRLKSFRGAEILISPQGDKENIELLDEGESRNILGHLNNALERYKEEDGWFHAREFLILLLDQLFEQLEDNLVDATRILVRLMEKSERSDAQWIGSGLNRNIREFRHLARSDLVNLFDINLQSRYPVEKGVDSHRLVGGITVVDNSRAFERGVYPLKVNRSGTEILMEESVNSVSAFLHGMRGKKIMNLSSSKPVAMGGFILTQPVDTLSMEILYQYFKKLLSNKRKNINLITKILKRVAKGIHISDVKKMALKLQRSFANIKSARDETSEGLYALNAVREVQTTYNKIRQEQLAVLKELFAHLEKVKKGNTESARIKTVTDNILVKVAHYQLKSRLYRELVGSVYRNMGLPEQYLGQMEEAMDQVDEKIEEETSLLDVDEEVKDRIAEIISNEVPHKTITDPTPVGVVKEGVEVVKKKMKKYKPDRSTSVRLSESQKGKIASPQFWEKVRDRLVTKMGSKTIYLPYIKSGTVLIQHGFFDLIESGITGNPIGVPGRKINRRSLGRVYSARGLLMVANDDADVDEPADWRGIRLAEQIGDKHERALRLEIYRILADKVDYMVRVGDYKWADASQTKIKVLHFCGAKRPYTVLPKECPFLTSRQTVGRSLGTIDGIPFK